MDAPPTTPAPMVQAAFGAKNRKRLIDDYFASHEAATISPQVAWEHVYRLLLWADQTTGLAHCYESDKCQPGKPWYSRSLAFHDWVSRALHVSPDALAAEIDWLFRRASAQLAAEILRTRARLVKAGEKQRQQFQARNFPAPGEDRELEAVIYKALAPYLTSQPSREAWQLVVERTRQHLSLENKRKNLVGEGFEDVLSEVVRRACPPAAEVRVRALLQDLPGFNRSRRGDKPNKVDVAILRPKMRTLVTAKWSVRADREKQFEADFKDYVNAEGDRKPFEYVFVTNEFDPARIMRACEKVEANALMFNQVVHINTDALRAAYGEAKEVSMQKVIGFIESGRLISLRRWLESLTT